MESRRKFLETTLQGHNSPVNAIAVFDDNKFVVSGGGLEYSIPGVINDCSVRVWNLEERRQVAVLQGHTSSVWSVAISHDKKYAVFGGGIRYDNKSDNSIRVWNLENKHQEIMLQGHSSPVKSIAITQNCKYIVSELFDCTVRVWTFNMGNKNLFFTKDAREYYEAFKN